uniref:NADH-ubiquinone oxidoreductase chain 6 n=1 Tax=Podallea sp. YW-2016 TaxID=1821764 RepID=A0A1S5QYW8_9NEOP|nr:NADH dehydrogenase subunit 6 [Podallea sp. YW-2016]
MYQFFSSLSIILTLNFLSMNHPLSMGLNLMIQTIFISIICGLLNYTYWFSYILFLIMIGGMLVLFIYMTSLASNELFSFSMNNFMKMIFMFFILLSISLLIFNNNFILLKNMDTSKFNYDMIINMENQLNLIKLYNNPSMNITLLMIIYLLLTLIIIVKITNINYGALRQSN